VQLLVSGVMDSFAVIAQFFSSLVLLMLVVAQLCPPRIEILDQRVSVTRVCSP
jgi:hypothetical protein